MASPDKSAALNMVVSGLDLPSMTEVLNSANAQSPPDAMTSGSSTSEADTSATDGTSTEATMTCVMSASPSPSQGSSKRHLGAHQHRFSAIHSHRASLSDMTKHRRDNTSTTAPTANTTSTEMSITKGYSDGFLTAKTFAQYGLSKLGFNGQYKLDSMSALGPDVIAPGTEAYYSAWFDRGLSDGESLVVVAVNQ